MLQRSHSGSQISPQLESSRGSNGTVNNTSLRSFILTTSGILKTDEKKPLKMNRLANGSAKALSRMKVQEEEYTFVSGSVLSQRIMGLLGPDSYII